MFRMYKPNITDNFSCSNSTCSCGSGDGSGGFHSPEARKMVKN